MSLQVNLSSRDIATAYQAVLSGSETDWALLTYEKASNDLKVQSTGSGGLEELKEEFSDGRIQYAFVRVRDPNTELPKFVQINWCGDGVPEAKKGLFHSHTNAVARYLKGTHVVINARNEADVSPELIMKRVIDASGSKYSVHKEPARKTEPIVPVGTRYTPVGKVDIGALRMGVPKDVIGKVGTTYTPAREELAGTQSKPVPSPRPMKSAIPAWEEQNSAAVAPSPTAPHPVPSATSRSLPVSSVPYQAAKPESSLSKPEEEERIASVGTAYAPVSLPPPRKLVNPFEARQKALAMETQSQSFPAGGGRKLTWSERQALAKKQQAEEESRSKAASAAAVGVGPADVTAVVATKVAETEYEKQRSNDGKVGAQPVMPLSPPPPAVPAISSATLDPELGVAPVSPPPPPPVAPPANVVAPEPPQTPAVELGLADAAAHPSLTLPHASSEIPSPIVHPSEGRGIVAVVQFDYEATEENEMDLIEGEIIEQIEQLDEGWWSGVGAGGSKSGLFPANYVEIVEQHAGAPPSTPPPPPPPPPVVPVSHPAPPASDTDLRLDEGVTAIALYDYDAAEDNEISFREGDKITDINAVSDDWWQGTTRDGSAGLFPSNYVQAHD